VLAETAEKLVFTKKIIKHILFSFIGLLLSVLSPYVFLLPHDIPGCLG